MRARTVICLLILGLLVLPASAGAARAPRVVDGYPTSNSQWPFIAALVTRGTDALDGQFCGGSVIAPTVVLTAAHCVEGESAGTIDVLTGVTYLSDEGAGQRIAVRAIRVDPSYNGNTEHHDAALLLLAQPTSAPPIAIARPTDGGLTAPGAPLTVAGWGINDSAGNSPDGLQAGALRAVSTAACADAWGSDITGSLMVCAGSAPGHRTDACDGDSGGPLVSSLGGPTRLVGLVAFGADACGDPTAPGVYTRASAELPWIVQTLGLAPPPAAGPGVSAQIGAIRCGPVLWTVDVAVSGNVGAIGRVVVTVVRGGSNPVQRAAVARFVSPGVWRARIELPFGKELVSAQPFTRTGAPFGKAGTQYIQVTAG